MSRPPTFAAALRAGATALEQKRRLYAFDNGRWRLYNARDEDATHAHLLYEKLSAQAKLLRQKAKELT